jgi:NTE family protein
MQYGSVATGLESGREIWFTKGPMLEAVWASIALPGLFPAIRHEGRWLVDGGLVNPVPVSVCRALGADVVIAVNLNGDIVGKHLVKTAQREKKERRGRSVLESGQGIRRVRSFPFLKKTNRRGFSTPLQAP